MNISDLNNLYLTEDKSGFLFLYHPNYGGFCIGSEIHKKLINKYNWKTETNWDIFSKMKEPCVFIDNHYSKPLYSNNLGDFENRTNKDIIESYLSIIKKHKNCPKYGKERCQSQIHQLKLAIRPFDFDDLINEQVYDGLETTIWPEYHC